ncbi:MAG TPA: DUF1015 domain-containing protein [Nocardioidaceae bacterium]|nr:DUF1015 domain-containing protein [Nocardioidaceae bacterium]
MLSTVGRAGLVMAPFRGLRFDPAVVGDLGSVISPPYDVLDADTVRDLEAGNRRNIVRLILSRQYERPYQAVRKRLGSWRDQGCLVPDEIPSLYLYQYTVDGLTVRGLIGLVGLRDEDEKVILPHEEVMPGPVEDRSVLMRTTRTNLEPILLVHEGSSALREILERASDRTPLVDFQEGDGTRHRLWSLSDAAEIEAIRDELAPGQALIADGHHRYAAYLALQRKLRDPSVPRGASPWDYGLAMLVDQHDYPLTVGPIHRSVAALTLSDVLDLSAERGDAVNTTVDRETAHAVLARQSAGRNDTAQFVLSDGRNWAVLTTRRHHEVDAAVLHDELFPAWNVTEEQVGYHHSLDQALHTTAHRPGIVVGVRPPLLEQVMASAARGERLPRKSTSFSPKPRMGLVLRDLRDA